MNASRTRRLTGALLAVLAMCCSTSLALAGPPSPPPALPAITSIQIGDSAACDSCVPHVCAAQMIPVTIHGAFASPCWTFLGIEVLQGMAGVNGGPIFGPTVVRVLVRDECPADSGGCLAVLSPFTGSTTLGPHGPGSYNVEVQLVVQSCADSLSLRLAQMLTRAFEVDSCPPPQQNCVWSFLKPANQPADSLEQCTLRLPPGGTGSIVFDAFVSGDPVAGVQGEISAQAPLKVVGIESAVPAPGMHVQWRPLPYGAAWTVFADHGAPIEPGWHSLLRVTVKPDSMLARDSLGVDSLVIPHPFVAYVLGGVGAAADSNGNHVDICYVPTFAMVAARVCIVPGEGCDVNLDGVVDVADLVRMVRCWFRPGSCPDPVGTQPDCTGDGAFHLDDVMCCARRALGEPSNRPPVPPGALSVAFETPVDLGGGVIEAPLVIRGAAGLDGALLHLVYPVDRYELAADPAGGDAGAGWMPLSEPGPGDVVLGLLRLDTSASGEIRVPVRLRLLPGQSPGGSLLISEGSLIAPDGNSIAVDLSRVTAPLSAGAGADSRRVELSRPMPNPSSGDTRFDVTLPAAASAVDLAIYDVAGRRVATLWHGSLEAGKRAFTWHPAGARGGVYFARLVVNGEVRASRLTLQGSR